MLLVLSFDVGLVGVSSVVDACPNKFGGSSEVICQNRSNVLTGRSALSPEGWCLLSICRHSADFTSMNRWSMPIKVSAWLTELVLAVQVDAHSQEAVKASNINIFNLKHRPKSSTHLPGIFCCEKIMGDTICLYLVCCSICLDIIRRMIDRLVFHNYGVTFDEQWTSFNQSSRNFFLSYRDGAYIFFCFEELHNTYPALDHS
ncbi:unnamed protein product [Prunus armeniaca]